MIDPDKFIQVLEKYSCIVANETHGANWQTMDWRSKLWLAGCRRCLDTMGGISRMVQRYSIMVAG